MNMFDLNPLYFLNPLHFTRHNRKVKEYNLSKGESKKCKSCKYFNKHLWYSACEAGKRRYASPHDIACDSHERRKR